MILVIALITIGLVGCVTSETVHLRNPTGHTVTCGPYSAKEALPQAEMMA